MLPNKQLLILLLTFIFYSCQKRNSYPYAIKDFREKLQPYLTKIVDKGIVMGSESVLQKMATDEELVSLGNCEHPILRASAFREMLDRKSFNHFDILMKHLDDTALVFTDGGEFGLWDRTVSDDILQQAIWKTQEEKEKTLGEVLSNHNYLRSAYTILDRIKPQEKYYPFIKDMATRPRHLDPYEGYELGFGDIEYALYGLSKFQKKEDVLIIKQRLMRDVWRLSDISFQLMKEFPDTAYLDVLQSYHRRQFYKFSGNRPHGFSGVVADRAAPEDFIQALVIQQNERSAKLLDTMLNQISMHTCMPDKENILRELTSAIWEHPCPAYAKLREKVRARAEEIYKSQMGNPSDTYSLPVDRPVRVIRWYN